MKIILAGLLVLSILVLLLVGFLFVKSRSLVTLTGQQVNSSRNCRLALSKSYFPQSILDYKLDESSSDEKDQAVGIYIGADSNKVYFMIRTLELSRKIASYVDLPPDSDSKYKSLVKDPNYLDLTLKAAKGEATQKELDKLAELADFNGSIKYENVDGLKVLTGKKNSYTPGYMPGFSYYDPQSQLVLQVTFSDGDKTDSVLYFKDWAKQVCAN